MTAHRDVISIAEYRYYPGFSWRFIDARSGLGATSDRELLGGNGNKRCHASPRS
ncbi:hypothetical protein ACUN9Y_05155 [Halomonas sp. V046]|uniref:hypothetical protein n=1 Tax=Halomonas sp. V046 TaxID=3459611 RepID=UPI004043DE3D